ncbi:MAG TPA: hypothetical protein VEV17_21640, partial [Bryobacteraceae bacterium]|nr:hypothetical protein [Bryobacteraceae bacterium]
WAALLTRGLSASWRTGDFSLEPALRHPLSLNAYAYANENPVAHRDPTGLYVNDFPPGTSVHGSADMQGTWNDMGNAWPFPGGDVSVYAHGGNGWWDDPTIPRNANGDPTAPGDIGKLVDQIVNDPWFTPFSEIHLNICHSADPGETKSSLADQIKNELERRGYSNSVYGQRGEATVFPLWTSGNIIGPFGLPGWGATKF